MLTIFTSLLLRRRLLVPGTSKTLSLADVLIVYKKGLKNPKASGALLGQLVGEGVAADYVTEESDHLSYFSLADRWQNVAAAQRLDNDEMIEVYVVKFIVDAVNRRKTFAFPAAPTDGFLAFVWGLLQANGYVYDPNTRVASVR